MRLLSVWVIEFLKLIGRRRLHPLNAECPFCHQMVRLHHNKAGRRHLFAHARATSRALYEGSRYDAHYAAATSAGAEIVRELANTEYGSREYSARDLDGHLWSFGTYHPWNGS